MAGMFCVSGFALLFFFFPFLDVFVSYISSTDKKKVMICVGIIWSEFFGVSPDDVG